VASVGVSLSFVRLLISCLWHLHCVTVFWSLLVSNEGWVLYAIIKKKEEFDMANFLYPHVIQSRFFCGPLG
jgi:hypothetical protein